VAERADKSAQWARVAARLREEIMAGDVAVGGKLDGEIALAERYGVGRGVIQRALALLREEGYIVTVHGQGSFVSGRPEIRVTQIGPGDRVTARMPEDSERLQLRMAPGVPLLVITRDAGPAELYDAAVTIVSWQSPGNRDNPDAGALRPGMARDRPPQPAPVLPGDRARPARAGPADRMSRTRTRTGRTDGT
jgi:DNA-binding transcriptional MocR family regulator